MTEQDIPEIRECRTCRYTFADRADQILHYKLDWHRHNLRLALKNLPPTIESTFNDLCEGGDDISSLSGSESDEDQVVLTEELTSVYLEPATELTCAVIRSPQLILTPDHVTFYKCYSSLLLRRCQRNDPRLTDTHLLTALTSVTRQPDTPSPPCFTGRAAVFLYTAQHFAAALFQGSTMVLHKTYHRYTVRAKQGTVQGLRDGKGNAPKSYGASLRRYNQVALFNDAEALTLDWGEELSKCHVIYYRVAQYNRSVFDKFKAKYHITEEGDTFVSIPVMTYRPTLKECTRVHRILTTVSPSTREEFDAWRLENMRKSRVPAPSPPSSTRHPAPAENPRSIPNSHLKQRSPRTETTTVTTPLQEIPWYKHEDHVMYHVIKAIETSEFDRFSDILDGRCNDVDTSGLVLAARLDHADTLLHLASQASDVRFLEMLLERGANPEVMNSSRRTPYELAASKDHRNSFRRFMARNPDQWDYKLAKIPSPLTPKMEAEQEAKKQVKKKQQRTKAQARQKELKAAEKDRLAKEQLRLIEDAQVLRCKTLTAREKCLLAAERRLASEQGLRGSTSGSCTFCKTGLDSLVPFEKEGLKFCSVNCVNDHRRGRKT